MVNPGHRSRGCEYCRKQKTRCDEGRPSCTRCIRRNQTCIYRTPPNQSFRSMNDWSESVVQTRVESVQTERWRKYGAPPSTDTASPEEEAGPSTTQSRQRNASRANTIRKAIKAKWCAEMPIINFTSDPQNPSAANLATQHTPSIVVPNPEQLLRMDYTTQSVLPFFSTYVVPSDELPSTNGYMSTLPSLYQGGQQGDYLRDAVHACGLINLGVAHGWKGIEVEAAKCYGGALRGIRGAIGSVVKDEMRANPDMEDERSVEARIERKKAAERALLCIMLCVLFESVSGKFIVKGIIDKHLYGLSSLLRICVHPSNPPPRARVTSPDPTNTDTHNESFVHGTHPTSMSTLPFFDPAILGIANRILLVQDLADRRAPTLGLESWEPLTYYRSWLDEAAVWLNRRIASTCAGVYQLEATAKGLTSEEWEVRLTAQIIDATDVEEQVEGTYRGATGKWGWRTRKRDDGGSGADESAMHAEAGSSFKPPDDIYHSPNTAHFWALLGMCHLHLLTALIKLRELASRLYMVPRQLTSPDLPVPSNAPSIFEDQHMARHHPLLLSLPVPLAIKRRIDKTMANTCSACHYICVDKCRTIGPSTKLITKWNMHMLLDSLGEEVLSDDIRAWVREIVGENA